MLTFSINKWATAWEAPELQVPQSANLTTCSLVYVHLTKNVFGNMHQQIKMYSGM